MNIEELMKKKISEQGFAGEITLKDHQLSWAKYGWDYKIPKSLGEFHRRTLADIFPFSPYAIKREEMWASVISGLLEQSADIKIDEKLIDHMLETKSINYRGENEELKDNLKAIFEDLYYIESKSARKVPYILPFHLQVIGNLKSIEPRGFNHLFRLLLLDDAGQFNENLFDKILTLFNEEATLTPIDKLFISSLKEQKDYQKVETVIKNNDPFPKDGYDFYKKQGELFQRDLYRILNLQVSRIEKVRYFSIVLGLHFGIYVIRISYYLDWEYSAFLQALRNENNTFTKIEDYDEKFRSKITFTFEELRTPKTSKPVLNHAEMSQVVYRSYIHMVLLNTVRSMCPNKYKNITFSKLVEKMKENEHFRQWIKICFDLQMIAYVNTVVKVNDVVEIEEYMTSLPEGNSFKRYEALVTKHFASQKPANRTPRTAGIQFIKQSVGTGTNYSFIASKQGIGDYFGIGKDLIILLVHLTIDEKEKKIRYKDFLSRISAYGFNPDHHAEESLLKKLEETGLLQKFSDSGEAMYVRTIF